MELCAIADFALAHMSSSKRFSCQPASSPILSCRGRRSVSPKQAMCDSLWLHEDVWICIMSLLDAKSILRLAVTSRHLRALATDDLIWKSVSLRDIGNRVFIYMKPAFSWMTLYLAACDGSHAFSHFETEKHIDWMRIGIFCLESGEAVATDTLMEVKQVSAKEDNPESDTLLLKALEISNVKKGLWIADLHLLHCPVCNLATCEGTMQVLDVRHWELFLYKEYKTRKWKFEQVYARRVAGSCNEAAACIFDANELRSRETQGLLNMSKWNAAPENWQPKGFTSSHGAAACTNLQPNQGLKMKVQTLKAGTEGPIMGIRLCQQLA